MNLKYLIIGFFFCLNFYCQAQCGTIGTKKPIEFNPLRSIVTEIPVVFLILKEDNGEGGVDYNEAEIEINKAVAEFQNIGINIIPCIRELHSTRVLNSAWEDSFVTLPCETVITVVIQTHGGGQAHLGGLLAHSGADDETIIHELGHIFGLNHTFANCDNEMQESVHQVPCGQPINSAKNCQTTGDFICDTPADSNLSSSTDCSPAFGIEFDMTQFPWGWTFGNFSGLVDNCGTEYVDPENIIFENHMSYSGYVIDGDNVIPKMFTSGQIDYMLNTISTNHTGLTYNCTDDSPIHDVELGVLQDNYFIYTGESLYFKTLELINTTTRFVDCVLHIEDKILLDNSNLELLGTTITNNGNCSGEEEWEGIHLNNNSTIKVYNESKIENVNQRAIIHEDESYSWLRAGDSEINGDIEISKSGHIIFFENVILTGKFKGEGMEFYLFDSTIDGINESFGEVGIDCNNCNLFLNELHYKNHSVAGIIDNGLLSLKHSTITDITQDGFYVSGADVDLVNTHFKSSMSIQNATNLVIENNHFTDCDVICNPSVVTNSETSVFNNISNNIFETAQKGIKARGEQAGLLFLCNDFISGNEYNFSWEVVHPIQSSSTSGIPSPSGNKFSSVNTDQVSGNSGGAIEYYHSSVSNERLVNRTNLDVSPVLSFESYSCGEIGPNFVMDDNDNSDDSIKDIVTDNDFVDDCPLGIDCSKPCPPGINCSKPCPPGINCFEPCPPGINCSEPCPPGINCFEPCPLGVNCQEPCHLGNGCDVECSLLDCPERDPVLIYLENQLINLQNDSFQDGLSFSSINYLITQINNLTIASKKDILNELSFYKGQINKIILNKFLEKSNILSEAEIVRVILDNPHLLLDQSIQKTLFRCESFSRSNMDKFKSNFDDFVKSNTFKNEFDYEIYKRNHTKVIKYALKRIRYIGFYNYEIENHWLDKLNDFSADLKVVKNFINADKFQLASNQISSMLSSNELTSDQINECLEFDEIIRLYYRNYRNGRSISDFSIEDQLDLNEIAIKNFRFSSSYTKNLLNRYYNYKFSREEYVKSDCKISFYSERNLNQKTTSAEVNISPNPNNGSFEIRSVPNEDYVLSLFNISGKRVFKFNLNKGENFINSNLEGGLYIFEISNNNEISTLGKIIIK